eukprot:9492118-Pyramimonas_sp.AAC.1
MDFPVERRAAARLERPDREQGWRLLQEASEGCPKGVEIEPPTNVGRYLGRERHVSTQYVEWHGELPTALDPPPPQVKKTPASGH